MTQDTIERLDNMFAESPVMRADEVPASDEVDLASQQVDIPFPEDYRQFLLRYGGAMVGPFPVFGLRCCHVMEAHRFSVVDVTFGYRKKYDSAGIDTLANWVIFSEDHSGNPIDMDAKGKVWIFDHDFGGMTKLASGFEDYIRTQCLKVEA